MSDAIKRDEAAFDAAAAAVTCLLNADHAEARRIVYSSDVLHEDMILILAGALAEGHTHETWQQALLVARRQS